MRDEFFRKDEGLAATVSGYSRRVTANSTRVACSTQTLRGNGYTIKVNRLES